MADVSDYNRPGRTDGQNLKGSMAERQKPNLMEEAKAFGSDLKQKAAGLGDTISQTAREKVSGAKEAAEKLASGATEKASEAFREQKSAGADYLRGLAEAVHRAAGELEREVPPAARFMHSAADQMDGIAGTVKDRNAQELFGDVQQFARRQPTLFFGGAMFLGFAALRFLKSAPPSVPGDDFAGTNRGA